MKRRYAVPAHETEEGQKRERAYHAALGEFVDMFSRAELAARFTLWHYAKTQKAIARAVFSGVHVDTAIGFIGRILDAKDEPKSERQEIDDVLRQLKSISDARNDILHYGARSVAEGQGAVTNELLAHMPGKTRWFPISPDILDDMTADLRKIIIHLLAGHMGRPPMKARAMLQATLRSPWRYKHQPRQTANRPAAAKRARKRGPKPRPRPQS